ncbi:hypothetical protein A2419_00695 [Candidatus Adlerbacteria bacterium RIFOXYC1_FULL_48_26]|uniref:YibE/F family protein n=1 Tax=Candidatus Adlerbacteria bacterium RIFOXYC1_FULL_48_26 TaxID=1797247 RepID=A0A1F4Y3B5_9BACT|nr:MAG: hypothetical protein A2419_00695 [Candidatus Adlerbacteria bacterium RIFOXYC1_FULL_48_26]OGC96578.1 MAG: hypothetical protein A2590_00185 [Candidatus Adlerbacteria bacterium RIFOXYD1_FULL_48_8]
MKRILYIGLGTALLLGAVPFVTHAQELVPDTISVGKARVLEMTNQHDTVIPGTDTPATVQTLKIEVLEGPDKGQTPTFENNFTQLKEGDIFYVRHISNPLDATDHWTVSDAYRLDLLIWLGILFLMLLFVFGGVQGIRGLLSLAGSLILIFYILLPGILSGYSPILVSIGVASLIIIAGSYVTHGFTKTTSAAVIGMLITVSITGALAYTVVHMGHFSGYGSEESIYLNFNTQGGIDMLGLLFGGIMIGLLGVLYDIAISQAIAVEELFLAGTHMSRVDIYKRAIRIGREHIGALVNTLAIAYVGVALPLLLLLTQTYSGSASLSSVLNSELFATEIVRILVGSIGLILAVPITTFVAVWMLSKVSSITHTGSHGHRH